MKRGGLLFIVTWYGAQCLMCMVRKWWKGTVFMVLEVPTFLLPAHLLAKTTRLLPKLHGY